MVPCSKDPLELQADVGLKGWMFFRCCQVERFGQAVYETFLAPRLGSFGFGSANSS